MRNLILRYWPMAILTPLLVVNAYFYTDWINSFWLSAYMGEYFLRHGSMPAFINSTQLIGMAYPIFYGPLLFKALALPSALLGANIGGRLAIVALWFLQFGLIRKLIDKLTQDSQVALFVAALVVLAIYPITNLLNRGAIAEVFATGFLTASLACWFLFLTSDNRKERIRNLSLFGLLITFVVGSHTITAVYGCFFIFIVAVLSVPIFPIVFKEKKTLLITLVLFLVSVLCVSPWIYSILKYGRKLSVTPQVDGMSVIFIESVDALYSRFLPFPFDKRALVDGIFKTPTPYLDAQLNVALLIFVTWFAYILFNSGKTTRAKTSPPLILFSVMSLFFVVFLAMSVWSGAYRFLPGIFGIIQFAYRLVTYQNLALLVGLVALFLMKESLTLLKSLNKSRIELAVVATLCLTIAGSAALLKDFHGWSIRDLNHRGGYDFHDRNGRSGLLALPVSFYGWGAYGVTEGFQKLNHSDEFPKVTIPVKSGSEFGEVGEAVITLDKKSVVTTNVQVSPWNHLSVDGVVISSSHYFNIDQWMGLELGPGKHIVSAFNEPDKLWSVLNRVSSLLLVIWILFTVYLFLPLPPMPKGS